MYNYNLLEKIMFLPTKVRKKKLNEVLHGKTILITGASSGIGEQVAYLLADTNAHLILVARRKENLLKVKSKVEKSSAKVSIFRADLRNEEELEELLMFLHELPNGLDVIVSNAGKSIRRPIADSLDRYHDFTRTMAINYFAPVKLLLSVIPILKKNHGQIINISTINALLAPVPNWAAYQASKSAFDTWLRSAAPELKASGVATTTIYLPLVKTPMILPTIAYEKAPAMNAKHVANVVGKSMYTRRKVYKPWWLLFGQLASVLFRWLWDWIMPKVIDRRGKKHEDH
jgi:short-subunit dehydrogenase